VVGSCEHGSEPSGFIKGGESLENMSECVLRRTLHNKVS
jgi:hypothetical protein